MEPHPIRKILTWFDSRRKKVARRTAAARAAEGVSPDRTLRELPWARSLTMVDAALGSGPLPGFVPIHPVGADKVLGPYVQPPAGAIFVRRPVVGKAPPPIALGTAPPDGTGVEESWAELTRLLGGLEPRLPVRSGSQKRGSPHNAEGRSTRPVPV